jgi:asparagine synthase (glutamine-hydrolysing)
MSRAKTALTALGGDGADAYALAVGVTTPEVRLELYSDTFRRAIGGYRGDARIAATMRDAPGRDGLDAAQYADFKHSLPGSVLAKLDRSSMAVGLEAREPLLDHRLVEFEATLPPSMRVRGGQGKWLMKRALEPWLPKDLLYRPEKCPLAPGGAWFRGALADEAAMLAKSPVLATWFDRNAVARLAEDHRSGRAEHGRTLWQLLMLEKAMARLFG